MAEPTPQRLEIADELQRRMAADQAARGLRTDGTNVAPDLEAMRTVDRANTAALERIITAHGWPGRSLVGEQGAHAAWCLAQHADDNPGFQRRARDLLAGAVQCGEAPRRHWAYLVDRCRVADHRTQLYGTQYGADGTPHPISDPTNLDARRAEVGLGPHAEYDAQIRAMRQTTPERRRPNASSRSALQQGAVLPPRQDYHR
ncbi:DUF6624 domain-containing protein [Streptomyces boninensis]|uniref:DUF6624 domain-containing protein n=1 Tax=Streptomyces boninensis TaxID=2039455 RepID=UPI003B2213A0